MGAVTPETCRVTVQ